MCQGQIQREVGLDWTWYEHLIGPSMDDPYTLTPAAAVDVTVNMSVCQR